MELILKFLMRNISEKKGRSALIVLSVMLSSALLLATTGMSTTLKDLFARRLSQYYGSSQIMVTADRRSPSWLHAPGKLERSGLEYAYAVPSIWTGGRIRRPGGEWTDVSVRGFEYSGLMEMSAPVWTTGPPEDFRGNRLILGEHSARFFGVGRGDSLTIHMEGAPHRFLVAAVARSTGLFTDDGRNHTLVLPLDKVATAAAGRGRASITYVRASEPAGPEEVASLLEEIREIYPRYAVRESVSRSDIDRWTRDTTLPFTIMSFLVFFMSVFIIYTCFRVITLERLPVIGTFRSVGATARTTAAVLLAEAGLYGLIGGLPGIGVGFGVLKLLLYATSNPWMRNVSMDLVVTPFQVILALSASLVLSVGSAAVPIAKASRLPVKDVILGAVDDHVRRRPLRYAFGGILFATGIVVPRFIPPELMLSVGSLCIFSILLGTVMALPWLVARSNDAVGGVNRRLFGNVGELAAKNLRNDPSVINNIALLTIGIASIFMISTMSVSAARSITDFYRDARFDIWMWTQGADRSTEARLRNIPGVTDVMGTFEEEDVEIPGSDEPFGRVQGISGPEVLDWWDFPIHDDRPESLLERLDESRSMILSVKSKRRLGLEKGEAITLMLGDPPRPRDYEIIGFFSFPDDTDGYGLVGSRWLKMDTGTRAYSDLWIKAPGAAESVKAVIEGRYARWRLWIRTMDEMEERNAEELKQVFLMLQFFSVLAMVIASVGIVNNFVVSYIERRRVLAVIRSVGMSRAQGVKMLLVEAFTGGILGALVGLAGGLAIVSFLPEYLQAFNLAVELTVSSARAAGLLVLGIVLSLGAQVLPAVRSRRMNLLEAIKYE